MNSDKRVLLEKIQKAKDSLDAAHAALWLAESQLSNTRALFGQDGYSVSIGNTRIVVAENGGRESGYAARLIRGREIIHLGCMKALDAIVDQHKESVKAWELQLKSLTQELAK